MSKQDSKKNQPKKVNLADIPEEEMEAFLAKRRAERNAEAEKKRKDYETQRDNMVRRVMDKVIKLNQDLTEFKQELHKDMDLQSERLAEYGEIRSTSKGGFSAYSADKSMRVVRIRSTEPMWDERSTKAVELIKDFLSTSVKKRDVKIYEILISFIQKNEKGELEFNKVMSLIQHRDKFDDERWVEGLKLIEESYSNSLRAYGYEFKMKDEHGKWQSININFTAL